MKKNNLKSELIIGPVENKLLMQESPLESIAKVIDYYFPFFIKNILDIADEQTRGLLDIKEIETGANAAASASNPAAKSEKCEKSVKLRITGEREEETLSYIKYIISEHRGDVPVIIYMASSGKAFKASRNLWVDGTDEFIEKMNQILGKENVKFQ